MRVYILRGLPGSGKSTWVKGFRDTANLAPVVVSADAYHMVWENGGHHYRFNSANSPSSHNSCLRWFARSVMHDYAETPVIVDNTNISVWEVAPYYRLAEALDAEVEIINFPCTVEESIARNVHGVPEATIRGMWERLQAAELPPFWKQTTYNQGDSLPEPE